MPRNKYDKLVSTPERSRFAVYRDRVRGGPPRVLQPCGTLAAYRRHVRHHEPVDDACRQAYNEQQRQLAHRRRATRRAK